MNYSIIDNGVSSFVEFNPISSPYPIIYRIRYQNGKLIIDSEFAFSNLNTTLGYTLDDEQTLNFNFDEYNTPDSITLNVGLQTYTLENNQSEVIESNVDVSIRINRTLGLPFIVKNANDEVIYESYYTNQVLVELADNTLTATFYSTSTTYTYTFTEYEDVRDYTSGLLNESTGEEITTSSYIWNNKAIILKQIISTDYMKVIFYKNSAESNRVDKTNFLTEYFVAEGTLKESTSIINPSMLIEFNLEQKKEIMKCNYAYIPLFNRYYYIQHVISEFTNLFTIELKVDVLMSNKDKILLQSGLVRRNEFIYNDDLVDSKMIQKIDYDIDITEYENSLFTYDDNAVTTYNYLIITAGR